MNRIDRLHAILTVLQSKRIVKAEELATRFDISLRTVYRDLRALEEGGIPIGAEAGVGYYLTDGFQLPPIMFTQEEARALLLAGKFLDSNTDQPTRIQFQNALTKVRAVLDNDKQEDLEGLDQKILINPFPTNQLSQDDLWLNQIKQALSQNKVIHLEYESYGKSSTREVESLGLCFYSNKWHLIGFCRLRQDYRDFRLDKIKSLQLKGETFIRIRHPSLREYLNKLSEEASLINVVVRVPKKIVSYIHDSKYSMGLLEETPSEEYHEMTFATFCLKHFSRWMIMAGGEIEIVSPEELKSEAKNLAERLYRQYGK